MKFICLILILAFTQNSFAQAKLVTFNKKGKPRIEIREYERCKIVYLQNDFLVKVKGNLHVLNDSQIMVDSNVILLNSIFKLGNISFDNQFFGHTIGLLGASSTGLGVYFNYLGIKYEEDRNIILALGYYILGSSFVSAGVPIALIGEYFAHGSMHRVNEGNRKLSILY